MDQARADVGQARADGDHGRALAFWLDRTASFVFVAGVWIISDLFRSTDGGDSILKNKRYIWNWMSVVFGLLMASNLIYILCWVDETEQKQESSKSRRINTRIDLKTYIEENTNHVKSNPNKESYDMDHHDDQDSNLKATLHEILKEATYNCNKEVVNKLVDEFKKHSKFCKEGLLRNARETCEEEYENKLRMKEKATEERFIKHIEQLKEIVDMLEEKYDADRCQWQEEKAILQAKSNFANLARNWMGIAKSQHNKYSSS